jgi:PAS domain S-box-containing protein
MKAKKPRLPGQDLPLQEMQEELADYRSLFVNMTEAFGLGEIILDTAGRPVDVRYLKVNEAFFRETGLPRDILGRPAREFAPDLEKSWLDRFSTVAMTGAPLHVEDYNAHTGRHYDVYCYSPRRGRFAVLFRDISTRVRMELALREREQEMELREQTLRQMVGGLPGLVWTASADGRPDYHSPQWEVFTGVPAAQLQDQGWLAVVHPEDRDRAHAAWERSVRTGSAWPADFRIRRRDGSHHWFKAYGTPLRDSQGKVVRWFGICMDIDSLKQAEAALQEAQQRYLALFNNKSTAVIHCRIVTDAAGRPEDFVFERVNDTYLRIVGVAREQVEGQRATRVFPGLSDSTHGFVIDLYGEIALHGGERQFEARFDYTGQWYSIYAYSHKRGEFTVLFSDITERKLAEAALRQSETELRATFEQAGIGVARVDRNLAFMQVNRTFAEMVGYAAEELQCLHVSEIVHDADRLASAERFHKLYAGESEGFSAEQRYVHKDGRLVWVRCTVSPIRNAGTGAITAAVKFVEDITERKRTRALLEGFFRQAAVGMAVLDTDSRMLRVNQHLCDLLGYDKAELKGLHYMDLNHPDEVAAAAACFRQLLDREIPDYTEEKRLRCKDGSYRWTLIVAALITDRGDGAPYIITVIQDIQARKQLEHDLREVQRDLESRVQQRTAELQAANAALRLEKERLRMVLETAADAYVAVDETGVIVEWNAAAAAMFGWTRQEALGLDLSDTIIPERYRAEHERGFARFAETGASDVMDHVLTLPARRRDGSEFPVEITLNANRIDGHWLINSFIRDITARKAAETALQQAKDNAEAANRAKTDFLATMSHEIRTPLNGVIGFTGLLLDGPLGEEKRHYAELARQSGESLLHLLNDFLDFSKIEAGRLELEPVPFDLHLEVSQVLALVQPAAAAKALALQKRIEVPHRLRGDAARLRQILLNLLANAVKFTARGSVTLCCAEAGRNEQGVRICFQVIDTGIGIDPAIRPYLFRPFVQAEAITRRFGGTGLGLAISKRLATAMGGEIGFRSTPGEGSTFWVELPFELMPAEGEPLPDASLAEFVAAPEGAIRGRVLVAEDNSVSQMLAAEVLKRLGCQVDVVGNGVEAVEAYRQLPYDLIFMDCDMPEMDGFEATRQIRALETDSRHDIGPPASHPHVGHPHVGHPHVPIIAMTASALQGDPERCIAAGMDDFMSKPLRLQHLGQVVNTWLAPSGDGEAPAAGKPPAGNS